MKGPGDFAPADETRAEDIWCCETCGDRRMDEPAYVNSDAHWFCADCAPGALPAYEGVVTHRSTGAGPWVAVRS